MNNSVHAIRKKSIAKKDSSHKSLIYNILCLQFNELTGLGFEVGGCYNSGRNEWLFWIVR